MTEQGVWSFNAGELCLGGEGRNVGRVTAYAKWDFSLLRFSLPSPSLPPSAQPTSTTKQETRVFTYTTTVSNDTTAYPNA